MLQQLSIKNIALIEDLTLELGNGFNVLSGETGAGKSIIIDALNLVLGERADRDLVRYGTDKAIVEGIFCENKEAAEIAEDNGIECDENTLIVRREISSEGKSVCRINGNAVTLSLLKKIADKLADIHGQHEHQILLNSEMHLRFLDSFAEDKILSQKAVVKNIYEEYRSCAQKLNANKESAQERFRKIEMLEYQTEEIEKASLKEGEEEELKKQAEILLNADKIRESLAESSNLCSIQTLDNIRMAVKILEKTSVTDESCGELASRLESVFYELEDIADSVKRKSEETEADPYELERIEDRLAQLKKLFRKYGADEKEVLDFYNESCLELDRLKNAEETVAELEKNFEKLLAEYNKQANFLSELRLAAASEFEKRIKKELSDLGMKNAFLKVAFTLTDEPTSEGRDKAEFLFSANEGEELKPLSKIISGGEMSRFMLALKSVAADDAMLPTMVFDEIDTGISGKGAEVVAQKIAALSKKHQVIAITHLPQLASMADTHFLIAKKTEEGRTHTEVALMDDAMRLREIARLAGGNETELALKRAEEIIAEANKYKNKIGC